MRVTIRNKAKRLSVLLAQNVTLATARQMVDAMSVAEIRRLAHYDEGDAVEVTVTGGNPSIVLYTRKV